MINLKNFVSLESKKVTLSGSSQNTAFSATINGDNDLRILNVSNAIIFVAWAKGGAATAASPNHPVAAGEDVIFNMGQCDNVAVIGAGAGDVYLEQGSGS